MNSNVYWVPSLVYQMFHKYPVDFVDRLIDLDFHGLSPLPISRAMCLTRCPGGGEGCSALLTESAEQKAYAAQNRHSAAKFP